MKFKQTWTMLGGVHTDEVHIFSWQTITSGYRFSEKVGELARECEKPAE